MPGALPVLAVALGVTEESGADRCPGRTNTTEIAQHITLQPVAAGSYLGYTGTSFSDQIPSDKNVHLTRATIASSTGELSWLRSITGSAGSAAGGPVLFTRTSFAGAQGTADLDVVDTGDILPLYRRRTSPCTG